MGGIEMVTLSGAFSCIDNMHMDVAESLKAQGITNATVMPLYNKYGIKILNSCCMGAIFDNMEEASTVMNLAVGIGAVVVQVFALGNPNMVFQQMFLTYDPSNGAMVFSEDCPNMADMCVGNGGLAVDLGRSLELVDIDLPNIDVESEVGVNLICGAFRDEFINTAEEDLGSCNIGLRPWEDIGQYAEIMHNSGEYIRIQRQRKLNYGAIIN